MTEPEEQPRPPRATRVIPWIVVAVLVLAGVSLIVSFFR